MTSSLTSPINEP